MGLVGGTQGGVTWGDRNRLQPLPPFLAREGSRGYGGVGNGSLGLDNGGRGLEIVVCICSNLMGQCGCVCMYGRNGMHRRME